MLIEDARWMLQTLKVHHISHTLRKGNGCADWLTKFVREQGKDIVLESNFPSPLLDIAHEDAIGIYHETR